MKESAYLNKEVQNDNVYTDVLMSPTSQLVSVDGQPISTRKGMENMIISNGKVVNVCSNSYGLLKNQDFFGKMERELIDEGISYTMRSFNHDDSRFYVDYLLDDESKIVTIGKADRGIDDTIVPMMRLTNSYDGKMKTAGYLGFFRKVCNNGLHMASTQIEFKVKHTKNQMELFIPNIENLIQKFLENEMYSISDKIQKMRVHFIDEKQIMNWVKDLATQEKVFKFEKSDKNDDPSLNAELVHDIVIRDAHASNTEPNAWLVYSAFNELIHGKLQKSFTDQKALDTNVFNNVSQLVGAY